MLKITFKNNGSFAEVDPGTALKDVTKKNNWSVAYGCEDGVCGTCVVKVVEGEKNLSSMEDKERATLEAMGMDPNTYRLCCQCKVNGDCTIEQ